MTMSIIPSGSGGGGAGDDLVTYPQRIVTTDDSPGASDRLLLVSTLVPVTIMLPTGMASDYMLAIKDLDGTIDETTTITLLCGGLEQIEKEDSSGLGGTYTMNVPFQSVVIGCTGTGRYFVV